MMKKTQTMKTMKTFSNMLCAAAAALLLTACGGVPEKTLAAQADFALQWSAITGEMSSFSQMGLMAHGKPGAKGMRVCTVSRSGAVRVFSVADGEMLYQVLLPLIRGEVVTAGAECGGDIIAAVSGDGVLHVRQIGGGELWTQDMNARVFGAPLLANKKLFVLGLKGRLVAYTQRQGRELWRYASPRESRLRTPLDSAPVLDDGVLYAGLNDGILVALDESNGRVLWENIVALPSGNNAVANLLDVTTPVAGAGRVCAVAYQGGVACFTRGGERLWSYALSGRTRAAMDDKAETVFVSDIDGALHAFDAQTGALRWRVETAAESLSAPLVVGGKVLVGDGEGNVHAFFADSGEAAALLQVAKGAVVHLRRLPGSGGGSDVLILTQDGQVARLQVAE